MRVIFNGNAPPLLKAAITIIKNIIIGSKIIKIDNFVCDLFEHTTMLLSKRY